VTGDSCKIGNYIAIYLTQSNPANGNLVVIGAGSPNGTSGIKTIPVTIPTTQTPGNYLIYANLDYVPPTASSGTYTTSTTCQPTPGVQGLQAYDYSDNYFALTN
jgi:hypothetical protein